MQYHKICARCNVECNEESKSNRIPCCVMCCDESIVKCDVIIDGVHDDCTEDLYLCRDCAQFDIDQDRKSRLPYITERIFVYHDGRKLVVINGVEKKGVKV